jgi:hypothetical protein
VSRRALGRSRARVCGLKQVINRARRVKLASLQAHAVVVRVALPSTLPFIAATTTSLVEPFGISSLPESAYSLKLVVLPLLGPR